MSATLHEPGHRAPKANLRQGQDGEEQRMIHYVDAAIPAVAGLVCIFFPAVMMKKPTPALISRMRKIGFVLLGVAALYLIIAVARG